MTATDNRLFFDSNIWLGYFLRSGIHLGQLVESSQGKIFTSIVSFHEVVKVLHRENRSVAFIRDVVRHMRENSTVVGMSEDIAVNAVDWCIKNKLSLADSVIYQSALVSDATLITTDSDFDGLSKVFKVSV